MSAFKQFNSRDVIVTPFKVNKEFVLKGNDQFIDSKVGIDRFIGKNTPLTVLGVISGSDGVGTSTNAGQIKFLY